MIVCNPCLLKDIKTLESVQCKFTKRLAGMKTLSYHQRVGTGKLGLESVEFRQLCADLLLNTYNLGFAIIKQVSDFLFPIFTELAATTSTNYIFQPVRAASNLTATLTEFCLYGTDFCCMKLI